MASGAQLRPFEVDKCPRCGERHRFALAVRAAQQGVAVFGGIQAQEIAFICPKTKLAFTKLVTPEEKTEIIGPADPSQVAPVAVEAAGATLSVTNPASGEFQDWQRSSRSIAIDFCKTMLTVATGAIPVYFTVLKYLGVEHASQSLWQRAAIIPPILFLVSAVLFVLALRPNYAIVTESDFESYRRGRLQRINSLILVSTSVFILSVAIATVIYFAILLVR